MKKLLYFAVELFFANSAQAQNGAKIELAKPSKKQIEFADMEVGAFIHFGLNVFTGQEHGDGQEPASKFNPTDIDVEQWVITAKKMGAKYACLTARHEGGFCLWPSKTTEYTIANSPYKDGKGDIVREFIDACHKHGIKPALYHTATFDSNATLGGDYAEWGSQKLPLGWGSKESSIANREAYERYPNLHEKLKQIQGDQMRELLTNYGPITYMWSDHWDATDPDGLWRVVTDIAAELQPDMVFMGPESWVPGNETGNVVYPMWNAVKTVDGTNYSRPKAVEGDIVTDNDYGLLETDVLMGHPLGDFWRVRECTTNGGFAHGGWFWHPGQTHPRTFREHVDLYYRTVGLGANVIINLPPDNRGRIQDDMVAAAEKLGTYIKEAFANPVAELKKVKKGDTFELSWKTPQKINTIVTMENIANGQKIAKYNLQAWVDGAWVDMPAKNRHISYKPYNNKPGYETIGHKKIDVVDPVVTTKIRLCVLEAVASPAEIRSMAVHYIEPIPYEYTSKFPYLSGIETEDDSCCKGLKRNQNFNGGTNKLSGKPYEHAIMIVPVATNDIGYAIYDLKSLEQPVKGFSAELGIDDEVGKVNGSADYRIELYSNGEWKEVFSSPVFTGGGYRMSIEIPIGDDVEKIKLINSDAGDGIARDYAVWGNAKFIVK